jgi:hypothetical protein
MVAAMVTVAMVVGCYEAYEIFTNFSLQWYWFVFALFYSVVINEYFGHFCCGHKLFDVDTRRITYKILAFLNCVDHAWGPPSSMSLTLPIITCTLIKDAKIRSIPGYIILLGL